MSRLKSIALVCERKLVIIFFMAIVLLMFVSTNLTAAIKNVPGDYTTIQSAVDAASADDTIQVAAGTYVEAVKVDKSLTLKGATGAIIKPDNTTPMHDAGIRRCGIYVAVVDNVTIEGFEIDGTGGTVHYGIYAFNSDHSTVRNNVLHDMQNDVYDVAGVGILFFGWDQGVDGAIIEGNTVYNTARHGIFLGGMDGTYYWWDVCNNNNIKNNTVHGTWMGLTSDWGGAIQLNAPENSTIEDNIILDTGLDMPGIYIFGSVSSTPNMITGNDIFGNDIGIVIWTDVAWGVPPGATLGSPVVSLNRIHDNAFLGLRNVDVDPLFEVDAKHNWWGDASGPYHPTTNSSGAGDPVSDNVDFSPWLSGPIPLIHPNGGEVIPAGSTYTIAWGAPPEAVEFDLKYSLNNGTTWVDIVKGTKGKSYDWSVPIPIDNKRKCRVAVIGYDADGIKVEEDTSDSPFTIEVVKIISPDGGEIVKSGEVTFIRWNTISTKKPVAKTYLYYSYDGGATWKFMAISVGNLGWHPWEAPKVLNAKNRCRVKVELRDATGKIVGSDASDKNFTIQPN